MVTITIPTAISGISRAQNKRLYLSTRLTPAINLIDTGHPPHLKTAKDKGDQTQLDVTPVQVLHHTFC
jgi:hypothetical protein